MSDVFDCSKLRVSDCPEYFIPSGAEVVIGVDYSNGGDCSCIVNGFYDPKTGEYHIQEVLHNTKVTGSPALSASPRGLPGYATEVEK